MTKPGTGSTPSLPASDLGSPAACDSKKDELSSPFLFVFDPESMTFYTATTAIFFGLYFSETIFMNCQAATLKDVQFMLSVNNFESIYILFKFLPQQLFLCTDYQFFPWEQSGSL